MLVERLRKELRLWPRNRWILLGAGILLACDGVLGLIWVCRQAFVDSVDTDTILDFAFLAPTCLWLAALAAGLIAWVIQHWNGQITKIVLLRLLDAQPKDGKQ